MAALNQVVLSGYLSDDVASQDGVSYFRLVFNKYDRAIGANVSQTYNVKCATYLARNTEVLKCLKKDTKLTLCGSLEISEKGNVFILCNSFELHGSRNTQQQAAGNTQQANNATQAQGASSFPSDIPDIDFY